MTTEARARRPRIHPNAVEHKLDVDGLRVGYVEGTRAGYDGPTVVLLHGTAGDAYDNFWALFPMFAFTRSVVAPDFALPPDPEPLTLDRYVTQAITVIDAASPGRPVALVGHSLGAVVAAAATARAPHRIESLSLVAGWMRTDRHQLLRYDIGHALDRSSPASSLFNVFTAFSRDHLVGLTESEFAQLLKRYRDRRSSERIVELNRAIDITREAAEIVRPTLVVACSEDQMVHSQRSRELFGAIADARYAEIPSGHAVTQERPADLYFLLEEFIRDPGAHPPGTVVPGVRI